MPKRDDEDAPPGGLPIGQATQLLQAMRAGDGEAEGKLLELLYRELSGLARRHVEPGKRTGTLQPTALIHEVWLKLRGAQGGFENRRHYLAVASKAMRQILADHARGQRAVKRDLQRTRITLTRAGSGANQELDVVDLDDSLRKLSELDKRQAQVVKLRFLCSLTIAETAEALGISHFTVESDWAAAKSWLKGELGELD